MKKWILSHRKIVTIFIIAVVILTEFILACIWKSKNNKCEYAEMLYYASQITSAFFVTSGAVIAVWQYYLSCIDSKRNIDVICVQKAVDLSEYYKDNILAYIAPIKYIFKNSGIDDILSKIDRTQIEHFDEKELNILLNSEDIENLKRIQQSNEFFSVVVKANMIYNLGLNEDLIKAYQNDADDADDAKLSNTDTKILSTFLGKLITGVLNNMEYFSLHFTHKVADETVVFESLHQTYIYIVQLLYYNIASKNPLSSKKYFTNIIELYKLWNTRSINKEKDFVDGIRALSNKGTVINNE